VCESIIEGCTGQLVDDLDAMTKAADELLTDADLRDRMGRAARDRASVFDWATSARRFSEALGIDQRLP
jgi:glycosyltransferase involved in cell wall biosynthesis